MTEPSSEPLDSRESPWDDHDMPKLKDIPTDIKEFVWDDTFQTTFDVWKKGVEVEQKGTLRMTHEEVKVGSPPRVLIFYFVEPRPSVARRRG